MSPATSPFKFLDSYTREDREIFFGRDREIEELYQKVFDGKMLLLYGVSGTGKTSLINCGLANKFEESDWLPVSIRRGSDINRSIQTVIRKVALTPLKEKTSLTTALHSIYLDHFKPVYLIFDQFEELFIFGDRQERDELIQSISELVESDVQCRLIFSIREEYLAGVTEFESVIPDFLANRMRIEKMTRQHAREVIEGPCRVHDITLEEKFPEALLEKLNPDRNEIELTYLQVFLDKIFRLSGDSSKFELAQLDQAGDVSDLLGSFLEEQISELEDPDTGLVILKAFVSVKGTKRQVTNEDITDFATTLGKKISEKDLKNLIQRFINLRILRDKDESGRYELRHDSLASKIYEKITLVEKELLEIKEYLENAYQNFDRRGIYLGERDLTYIAPYEDKLILNRKLQQFISDSKKVLMKSRRRRRRVLAAGAVGLFLVLIVFTGWALNERRKAFYQKILAEQESQNAIEARDEAVQARDDAENSRKLAEDATGEALLQKSLADSALVVAESQREFAEQQQGRAETLYEEANEQKLIAEEARKRTEESREEVIAANRLANFHLYVFNGKELANKSLITQEDDTLKALLALTGYELINYGHSEYGLENTKTEYDPEILEALQESLFLFNSDSVFHGEIQELDFHGEHLVFSNEPGRVVLAKVDVNEQTKLPSLQVVREFSIPGNILISSISFDQVNSRISVGTTGGEVILLNSSDGSYETLYNHEGSKVLSVELLPDKDWLVSTATTNTVIFYDLQARDNKRMIIMEDIQYAVETIDSRYILTSTNTGKIRLWDTDDLDNEMFIPRTLFNMGRGTVYSLDYNPDNQIIAAGIDGNTLLFSFSPDDIHELAPMSFTQKHKGIVSNVQFSGDNNWLSASGWDGLIMIWDVNQIISGEISRIDPITIHNPMKIFSLGFENSNSFLLYGDNRNLHFTTIDIDLAYIQLKKIVGDRELSKLEWEYYIKGNLNRPSNQDLFARVKGANL